MVAQLVPYWQIKSFNVGKGTGAGADEVGTELVRDVGTAVNTAERLGALVGLLDNDGDGVGFVSLLGE